MWWTLALSAALAGDCTEPVDAYIERLRAQGAAETYDCLIELDEAAPALAAIIAKSSAEDEGYNRLTRALTVHLIQRLDEPLDGQWLYLLQPVDMRLLRDAVYARRGRPTPESKHEAVFVQLGWYKPDPRFTKGRLLDVDRANIALIDDPPPPPEPVKEEPALAAVPNAVAENGAPPPPPEEVASATKGCRCSTAPGGLGILWSVLPGLVAVARRR